MKSYTKKILSTIILLLVISCSLESTFSLPNDEKIQTELIGEWTSKETTNEFLKIEKKSDKTYNIIIAEKDKTEKLLAFSKTINGFSIMNIITEYDGKITNVFYGFNIEGDTLTYSEVNNKLRENEFNSEIELLDFFKEKINRDDFFINRIVLVRK